MHMVWSENKGTFRCILDVHNQNPQLHADRTPPGLGIRWLRLQMSSTLALFVDHPGFPDKTLGLGVWRLRLRTAALWL